MWDAHPGPRKRGKRSTVQIFLYKNPFPDSEIPEFLNFEFRNIGFRLYHVKSDFDLIAYQYVTVLYYYYHVPMMIYITSVLFSMAVWCPCMAMNVVALSVCTQYNVELLLDIILLTQCYYHRGTRSAFKCHEDIILICSL